MNKRKILIVDTSILLYDMKSIHSFPGNDVVIPLIVLDELDRFKEKQGLLGEAARYVNRYLDDLRNNGNLNKGILIEKDQSIRVELRAPKFEELKDLDYERGDNRIIATALLQKKEKSNFEVKVITKDINLRVKCDSVGIAAEDYFNDHVELKESAYSGLIKLDVSDEDVDALYEEEYELGLENIFFENQFIVAKSSSQSFIGIYKNGKIRTLKHSLSKVMRLEPKNKEQRFAVEALCEISIPLVTLTGLAGSGKTFLTLMCALEAMENGKYDRIIITRSIQPVGRDLGFLPGDMNEKMQPWLAPIIDNIKVAFKDQFYFDMLVERGKIEIAPLTYIRGRTFNNCYVIVDEAQNTTIHELKTIITRVGENSKVVLLGDTDQIDTPYINKKSNGLSNVIAKFKYSKLHAHVNLERGQRSDVASEASKIL